MANNQVAQDDLNLNNLSDEDFEQKVEEEKAEDQNGETKIEETLTEETQEEETQEKEAPAEEETNIEVLVKKLEKELENTNVRYENSSKEGKRLYEENKKLQEKIAEIDEIRPVIDLIKESKELQDVAKQIAAGTYKQSLPDEPLDLDEAVRDPNSASAKVLNSFIERKAAELVNAQTKPNTPKKTETNYDELNAEIDAVAKELKMSEAEVEDVIAFAKSKNKATFRDMVNLYSLEKGKVEKPTSNVASILEQIKQLNKTSKIETNVKGGEAPEVSLEKKVAKMIHDAGGSDLTDMIPQ